jgi:hypothetical protein
MLVTFALKQILENTRCEKKYNFITDMTERKLQFGIYERRGCEEKDQEYAEIQSYISNLLEIYLPRVSTINVRKINIELTNEPDIFFITPENLDYDIIFIRKTFDFNTFGNSDLLSKKELLFKCIYDCLTVVFKNLEIDNSILKSTYELLIAKDAHLSVDLAGGPKLNRRKDITAKVIAEFFIGYVLVSTVFTDKNDKLLNKINLFKTLSHHLFYLRFAKTTKWLDNDVFQIADKAKEVNIQININGKVLVNYAPIDRDIDGIKEEIRFYNQELLFEL